MMEADQRPASKPVATTGSRFWTMSATAIVLSASLILAACGGGDDTTAPPASDATIATPAVEDTAAEEEATAAPEATESSEVVDTETEVITDTDVTTETEVTTETNVVTDVGVTTVTTDTVVTTETEEDTETETLTDTEIMTDTESETDAETVTGTEGVTDTEGMTETEGTTETGSTGTAAAGAATTDATSSDAAMMGVSGVEGNQYVRASTLLDYDFENMGGEVSGDLEDLLIDLSTGRVLFAAIEYGGILDLGDKDIVVPLNAFAIGPDGELILNIDETALENYPDVGNDWPDLNDPAWDDDVNNFWNETGITGSTDFSEATTSVARASELMGHRIADLGAGAGSVLDILVNLGTGRASYFIVDYGEGLDTDPYIIPVSAYNAATWQEELAYGPDFTPDMLENAPRFDQDAYPDGTPLDNDFGDNVESFWNNLGFRNDLNNDEEID